MHAKVRAFLQWFKCIYIIVISINTCIPKLTKLKFKIFQHIFLTFAFDEYLNFNTIYDSN
jgi:hypothetical protein